MLEDALQRSESQKQIVVEQSRKRLFVTSRQRLERFLKLGNLLHPKLYSVEVVHIPKYVVFPSISST